MGAHPVLNSWGEVSEVDGLVGGHIARGLRGGCGAPVPPHIVCMQQVLSCTVHPVFPPQHSQAGLQQFDRSSCHLTVPKVTMLMQPIEQTLL